MQRIRNERKERNEVCSIILSTIMGVARKITRKLLRKRRGKNIALKIGLRHTGWKTMIKIRISNIIVPRVEDRIASACGEGKKFLKDALHMRETERSNVSSPLHRLVVSFHCAPLPRFFLFFFIIIIISRFFAPGWHRRHVADFLRTARFPEYLTFGPAPRRFPLTGSGICISSFL